MQFDRAYAAVLWIPTETAERLQSELAALASVLHLPQQRALVVTLMQSQSWLLHAPLLALRSLRYPRVEHFQIHVHRAFPRFEGWYTSRSGRS